MLLTVRVMRACARVPSRTRLALVALAGTLTFLAFASTFLSTLTCTVVAFVTVMAARTLTLRTTLGTLAGATLLAMMTGFALVPLARPLVAAGCALAYTLLPVVSTGLAFVAFTRTRTPVVRARLGGFRPDRSRYRSFCIGLLFFSGTPRHSCNHEDSNQELLKHTCLLSLLPLTVARSTNTRGTDVVVPCPGAPRDCCVRGIIPESPALRHKKVTKLITER